MTFLPDINLWIALAVIEHDQHAAATQWFESTGDAGMAFCRVTQMGFLRLLTNRSVMKGDELTPDAAWRRLERIRADLKPLFAAEPAGLEKVWQDMSSKAGSGSNFWTDAYLAAFAKTAGYTFVTFDRGVSRYGRTGIHILRPA